jgi:ABC-2 type transport system ATP-binding protein
VAEWVSAPLDGRVDTTFTVDADHLNAMIGRLHAARIHTLTVTPPSLDALFLHTYGETPDTGETDPTLTEAGR